MRLSDMVGRRLRAAGRRGGIVSVGVVYRPDAGHISRQARQPRPVGTGDEIYQAALKLLAERDNGLHEEADIQLFPLLAPDPDTPLLLHNLPPLHDLRTDRTVAAVRRALFVVMRCIDATVKLWN